MSDNRDKWGSKIGLILAMAGSAVGLGNFWRYPYQAAANGGGAFMIPYIAALLLIGVPVAIVEWTAGRYGGVRGFGTLAPMFYLQAKEKTSHKKSLILAAIGGSLGFSICLLCTAYYNQVVGWTLGYSVMSVAGTYMDSAVNTAELYAHYIQTPYLSLTFWIITMIILVIILKKGINGGIEPVVKVLMPLLYIIGIIIAIRAVTLGSPVKPDWSAVKGLEFLWTPDWKSLNWNSVLAAVGQVFFTLALGQVIIQNYASYVEESDDIVVSSLATVSLNEFAEVVLGGTIAIPITYAFMGPEGLGSGVGLAFISLPNVFRTMIGGRFVGVLWFMLLFFAGITTSLALYNYISTLLQEDMNFSRSKAANVTFWLYIIMGLPIALEPIITQTSALAFFTELDNWNGSYLMVVLGLFEVIIAGWLFKDKFMVEVNKGSLWKVPSWLFNVVIRFITPAVVAIVLFFSTIEHFKSGYLNLIPEYIKATPELIPWVVAARILIIAVFIYGFIQCYNSTKRKFSEDFKEVKVSKNDQLV